MLDTDQQKLQALALFFEKTDLIDTDPRFKGVEYLGLHRIDVLLKYIAKLELSLVDTQEVARAALDWIDTVPSETVLPAMPGFDRDWAEEVLSKEDLHDKDLLNDTRLAERYEVVKMHLDVVRKNHSAKCQDWAKRMAEINEVQHKAAALGWKWEHESTLMDAVEYLLTKK